MILPTLFFICAFIVYPSLGKLDSEKFSLIFEDMCFQNENTDPFKINGQETPLSNTLENFIALAEKFEAANPQWKFKDELAYFISEFVYENLEITSGSISQFASTKAKLETVESMWDPAQHGYDSKRTDLNDPFTDDEKCSLYYMISHSILKKDEELIQSYSPRNGSYEPRRTYSDDIHPDDYFPQELGVVAIRGTDSAVSLSRVLMGLYVGLNPNRNRELDLNDYDLDKFTRDVLPVDTQVDNLYTITLAEVLMQSSYVATKRTGLAPNGQWVSIPLGQDKLISGFCPMVYKQESYKLKLDLPAYSYSSVRGAADGLILGLSILPIYEKKPNLKLSQILRMYYSPDGISLESQAEDINVDKVSFCQRQGLIESVESTLFEQMKSYGILTVIAPKDASTIFKNAKQIYEAKRREIYDITGTGLQEYCDSPRAIETPENLPRETYLDVIVVLDSRDKDNFYQEQLIVGHLAKRLDLRYTGSRMTILLDHKNSSGSATSSRIELMPVVNDTSSSACAACNVGQISYMPDGDSSPIESLRIRPSTMEEDEVILAINQLLSEKKINDANKNGANGKVVIYFNYGSENGKRPEMQGKLKKALTDLHLTHLDVLFYAVGLDQATLEKFTKADGNLVFLGTDGTPENVAEKIFKKLSYAPALLQYADCHERKNEKAAVYDNFVSNLTIQHYEMPAEYFYKSIQLSVKFEAQNGYIRVCHNRATTKPENLEQHCKDTTTTSGVEFKLSNPCIHMSKETCRPFYFSIMGMKTVSDMKQDNKPKGFCEDIKDHWCSNIQQIKYTVSHSGIRCNGCLGLNAPPAVILFAFLLSYILLKRF